MKIPHEKELIVTLVIANVMTLGALAYNYYRADMAQWSQSVGVEGSYIEIDYSRSVDIDKAYASGGLSTQ